jgi:hypothetical protein
MSRLSEAYKTKIKNLVADYGYLDEKQDALLDLFVDGAAEKLYGAGVKVQEDNPEYTEAVTELAAYRYLKRTAMAGAVGGNDEDKGYTAMVRDYVYRLRYPEVTPSAP